jgi:hypothetical protein
MIPIAEKVARELVVCVMLSRHLAKFGFTKYENGKRTRRTKKIQRGATSTTCCRKAGRGS